jgi:HEPN domain-containing protein
VGNQFAARHVQQAIEKVAKASLPGRGVEAGIQHRFENLAGR